MSDLEAATSVVRNGQGKFRAELSPSWEIWGPNGGYLAAVLLRAAGAHMERDRPVSISVHFLGAGSSGEADITVETNRATRVATSVTIRLTQNDRPWLIATVWGADGELPGLEHQTSRVPDCPHPSTLQNVAELMGDAQAPHPFWLNIENRPMDWITDWEARVAGEPITNCWSRFTPTETFADPWVDAGRSAILLDVDSWGAASRPHVGELEHYAPTIEFTARFVGSASKDPWLLSRAESPIASNGLMAATGEIWTTDHRLVAIGGSTLLCRPATRRPDR